MIGDMNKSMDPVLQRLLYGVMVLSAIATVAVFTVAFLVHEGIIPVSWVM
jgi:hypothetical protein